MQTQEEEILLSHPQAASGNHLGAATILCVLATYFVGGYAMYSVASYQVSSPATTCLYSLLAVRFC